MTHYQQLWTTDLAPGVEERFDELARNDSVPFFKSLPGCIAAVFARTATKGYVLTQWTDLASAAAASQTPEYGEAVQRIVQSGVMVGAQSLEALNLSASFKE